MPRTTFITLEHLNQLTLDEHARFCSTSLPSMCAHLFYLYLPATPHNDRRSNRWCFSLDATWSENHRWQRLESAKQPRLSLSRSSEISNSQLLLWIKSKRVIEVQTSRRVDTVKDSCVCRVVLAGKNKLSDIIVVQCSTLHGSLANSRKWCFAKRYSDTRQINCYAGPWVAEVSRRTDKKPRKVRANETHDARFHKTAAFRNEFVLFWRVGVIIHLAEGFSSNQFVGNLKYIPASCVKYWAKAVLKKVRRRTWR